ncbi:MAG: alkaline phosphatase family protein [Candidatus Aminicenantes bacterium]|jgi:predicted AlkP superfamily phosphohydrolase/phosphomutase
MSEEKKKAVFFGSICIWNPPSIKSGLASFLPKRGIFLLLGVCIFTLPADAYIGPGAGFAFLSSFLVLFLTFFLAVFSFLSWPFRLLMRLLRGQKAYKKSRIDQLVIVGLDGMEPTLVEKYMQEGKLPNLSSLKKEGSYARLQTTTPAISPVAWSSFMTGSHPGKHNIFDFLSRDPKTYLPDLSSARIGNPKRFLPIGKYKIPLSKPEIKGMRKSIPFWKILGDSGIFSSILRIPITFPPEKFRGHLLSGMCAPDLKGSQGTFTLYTSETGKVDKHEGGMIIPVTIEGDTVKTYISGPENSLLKKEVEMHLPMTIHCNKEKKEVHIEVSGQKIHLEVNTFSDWVKIAFRPGLGMKVRAICRFYISEITPHFKMYLTPLNIDPEKPALPISHPFIYSVYLSKLLGDFTTLGEADDTWALNEGILSEDSFIKLAYDNHQESEDMLFNAMAKTKKGVVACWFQTTDSIQHMFFRYLDKGHPALKHGQREKSAKVIEELYKDMDDLVGRVRKKLNKNSMLIVMSDHGFKSFRRGVNINSWLYKNGFLNLKDGKLTSEEWFKDVDWKRTKAYGLGLGGIYINQRGREAKGIVNPGEETKALKEELSKKLSGLKDDETGEVAINTIYDREKIPPGPYIVNCPDFIVGYNIGYRVSWDSVTGVVNSTIFEDNTKAWSGDHCIDPKLVPGIIFSNFKLNTQKPSIIDIAPTALELFGVKVPPHMDGKVLIDDDSDIIG